MKFKKYQWGGKTPKEIMAEARRNQAIERQAQTRDVVSRSGIPAHQSASVTIQTPRSPSPGLKYFENIKPRTFGEAFAEAEKAGLKEFDWLDPKTGETRTIAVKLAEEEAKEAKEAKDDKTSEDKTSEDKTSEDKTSEDKTSEDKTSEESAPSTRPVTPYTDKYGFILTRPVVDKYGNIIQGPAAKSITNRQQHAIDVSRLPEISRLKSLGWNWFRLNPGVEPTETGWENTSGEIQANRFITSGGKDVTFLSDKNTKRIFERNIQKGDTTYVDHGRGPLASYKKVFADGDEKLWESRGYRPGRTGLTAEERERNRLLAIPQGEGLPAYKQGGYVTNKLSMKYKQGGQIPKFEQGGGILDRIKQKLSERFTDPNRYQVNADTWTTYEEKDPFIGAPTENRYITGPNRQTSKMVIRRPGTERADTTFYSPGRAKNPDLYPPFTPQDIREGNRKGKGNESFMQKFTSPDYFPHLRKYQQGGPVEETNEEMVILDFAIRYLRGLGISETELESGIPEQWLQDEEFISTINTFANDPDAMMAYQEDPEATIQNYLSAEQELADDQVEFAKKGAKLKQLKSKQKRCKCGCSMESKEEGGKITETCTCCGNKITKHESGGLFNRIYNPKENNPKNFKATSVFSEVKGQKNPTYHNMNRDGKFIHPTPIISEIIQDGDTIYRTGTDWTIPSPRLGRANTTEGARSNSPYREDYERAKNYFYNLYNNSEAEDIIQEGYEVRRIRDSLRNKYDFKRIYGQ